MNGEQALKVRSARRFRTFFFALSGTLTSKSTTDEAHLNVVEALVNAFHITTEPPLLLKQFNELLMEPYKDPSLAWMPHREAVRRALSSILEEHGIRAQDRDRDWFYETYLSQHQSFVRTLPGARELLEEAGKLGVHVGLIANHDADYLERQLCWLDIRGFFQSVTSAEEVGFRKPSERIFRAALEKAGCRAEQAVMVGDSLEMDIEGGKSLGMTTVLADTEMRHADLERADFTATSPKRVAHILIELAYSP